MKLNTNFLATILMLSGCMVFPMDGEDLQSRVPEYIFDGYVTGAQQKVDIQIYDFSNESWVTFGTVNSSYVEGTGSGAGWYPWQKSLRMPRTKRFWPSNQMGLGKVRAVSEGTILNTGDESLWLCVLEQIQYNLSYSDAYQFCSSGPMKEVSLLGNCDVIVNGGCYDSFNITHEKNWPDNKSHNYTEVIQGVTHDNNAWYMTSTAAGGSLVKYGKNSNLTNNPVNYVEELFSPGWYHPGDLDYSNGWLYVALEKTGDGVTGNASSNAIGAIPTSSFLNKATYLTFNITSGPQQNNGTLPWIARDPGTNYFYSSVFTNTNKLQRYKASFTNPTENGIPTSFQHCGEVTLNSEIERVQGGAFSDSGKLYLSSDARDESSSIIKVIDLKGHLAGMEDLNCSSPYTTYADIIKSFNIQKDYGSVTVSVPCFTCGFPFKKWVTYYNEEVEGITIWNLSSTDTPSSNAEGSIHVILLNREPLSNDSYWLKHIKINPIENL